MSHSRTQSDRIIDVLAMGRSLVDLYSNEIGAPFPEIKSFNAYVGGCPTNISVGTKRLGLATALLTAVGADLAGDFILNFLTQEGLITEFIPRKAGRRTSAVMLSIEPPDKFPLVYYRDNCADLDLTIDDVLAAPLAASRILLITGTGLTQEPSRSATILAAEQARAQGTTVFLDLDFRRALWHDARAYGVAIRSVLRLADVVIGTAEELTTALAPVQFINATAAGTESEPWSEAAGIEAVLAVGPEALVIKRGGQGTSVYLANNEIIEAAIFPVSIYNSTGAGDAFAAGLLYGYLKGWGWYRAARMGNACGAIVVTRHGCANFMPYEAEALAFIEAQGGF